MALNVDDGDGTVSGLVSGQIHGMMPVSEGVCMMCSF